jgi:hypothetical protein
MHVEMRNRKRLFTRKPEKMRLREYTNSGTASAVGTTDYC